jgi:CTP:molybdopterin cytidylyltransferase MocA
VTRVVAFILHGRPGPGSGRLTEAFAAIRRRHADTLAERIRAAGADESRIVDEPQDDRPFGARLRDAIGSAGGAGGILVLGSGSVPLARIADLRAFVATAGGPAGQALANNAYSADLVAIAGSSRLAGLPDVTADNILPRWLAEHAGFAVSDVRRRWRLQVDLDSPLDVLLVGLDDLDGIETAPARAALAGARAIGRDPSAELVVAGRASANGLAWLERSTASRTRALVEERGFRTRPAGQRPARSSLGLLLDRDGPEALGSILAELGDAALVDTRVLLAHRFGTDERGWPVAEDRFASDLLLPERIADPWLRTLTVAASDARIPIVLGGHSLVGPGLRLALGRGRSWS